MATKTFKARIQNKHDTEANWNAAVNFKPLAGELIIYDEDNTHSTPRFKVGDGNTLVNNLPFYPSGDVTAAGDNTFTGTNTFETEFQSSLYRTIIDKNGVSVGSGPSSGILVSTTYDYNRINYTNSGTTYMYYFPSANGTLALTSDIDVTAAGNNTFTGNNSFQGGATSFTTVSPRPNTPATTINSEGVHCQTEGDTGTYYKNNQIIHQASTLTLPYKTGTLATTDDIKIKSASLSGTTLTLTI